MSAPEPAEAVEERRPARGYSWPPFEPGNEVAVRHGAYSPRRVEPLANELVERVVGQAQAEGSPVPWLRDVTYAPAVWAWARAEARVQLLEEWLMSRGSVGLDDDGEAQGALKMLVRYEASAARARQALGLDPLARAKLGSDVTAAQVNMAKLMAEDEERERRERSEGGDGGR